MWPGPFEQIFVPPSQGGSIWNLASIGPVVSEEKVFENVDIHTYIRTTEAYLYYKLTNEPKGSSELKISLKSDFIQFFVMILYMCIDQEQGLTTPWEQNFDVNRKILSLRSFVASFKTISLMSDFIQFFS